MNLVFFFFWKSEKIPSWSKYLILQLFWHHMIFYIKEADVFAYASKICSKLFFTLSFDVALEINNGDIHAYSEMGIII